MREAKQSPIDIGWGQLVGIGRDINGNKIAKFKTNTGKSFSIQTNSNLPYLHKEIELGDVDKSKAEKEVLAYVKKYGTKSQKEILPEGLDNRRETQSSIIEIFEPVRVGEYILEKGDKIKVLKEEMFKGDNGYRFDDRETATEIEIYLENDRDLYNRQFLPIIDNIKKKIKSGRYDHSLAPKLWMYFVDNGVKKYIQEFGSSGNRIDSILSKKDRMELATKLSDYYYDAIMEGEYN